MILCIIGCLILGFTFGPAVGWGLLFICVGLCKHMEEQK